MKNLFRVAIVIALSFSGFTLEDSQATGQTTLSQSDQILSNAAGTRRSDFQIEGEWQVVRILSDDVEGGRHQRFIIRLKSGQTLLVAHNIDLAPRVINLEAGDMILFKGEYEWNAEGGVLHWTHRDPDGSHAAGWLTHRSRTYQ